VIVSLAITISKAGYEYFLSYWVALETASSAAAAVDAFANGSTVSPTSASAPMSRAMAMGILGGVVAVYLIVVIVRGVLMQYWMLMYVIVVYFCSFVRSFVCCCFVCSHHELCHSAAQLCVRQDPAPPGVLLRGEPCGPHSDAILKRHGQGGLGIAVHYAEVGRDEEEIWIAMKFYHRRIYVFFILFSSLLFVAFSFWLAPFVSRASSIHWTLSTLAVVALVGINMPWFFLPLIPIFAAFAYMFVFFIKTSRQLKRIEAASIGMKVSVITL
jgi:hypothetical protein